MLVSLKNLLKAEYNKTNTLAAVQRFTYWKFIKALKLNNIRYRLWGDREIYLNHDSFQSMWIMYNYIVDWEEFHLIKNFTKPEDQVFDIGANMGFYTIWMSKFIGKNGHIHSFEPDEKNFNRLKKNILLNNLSCVVEANRKAVSNVNEIVNFTSDLDGENHIVTSSAALKIEAIQLDTYAKQRSLSYLSYVKIDVEGFEYFVLKGAEILLAEKRIGILQLEINKSLSNSGASVLDLLDFLTKHEYRLCRYNVEENKLSQIEYDISRENYFAVHSIDSINNELNKNIFA